jgi:hypothetical protein
VLQQRSDVLADIMIARAAPVFLGMLFVMAQCSRGNAFDIRELLWLHGTRLKRMPPRIIAVRLPPPYSRCVSRASMRSINQRAKRNERKAQFRFDDMSPRYQSGPFAAQAMGRDLPSRGELTGINPEALSPRLRRRGFGALQ